MKNKEIIGTFEETRKYQMKYQTLLSVCDEEGTMVSQDRLLEKDHDIGPYRFFRRGTREYIFSQQDVSLAEDKSHVIDPSPKYGLRTEEQTFNFDESAVEGRIRIEYGDSGNQPILKLFDVLGDSKLPKKVKKTIDDVFETE